jgi:hypothetical protein
MPADFLKLITPSEIIARRALRAADAKDAAREKMMADDSDYSWPPPMLTARMKVPR